MAFVALMIVRRGIGVILEGATMLRVGLIAAGAYVLSRGLPGPGLLVVLKLALIAALAAVALVLSGEIAPADVAAVVQGEPREADGLEPRT